MNEYIARITAVQFTGSNLDQVRKICPKARKPYDVKDVLIIPVGDGREALVSVGDYVVSGKAGLMVFSKEEFQYANFELVPVKPLPKVRFVYDKNDGYGAKWRTVEVTAENVQYIEGVEPDSGEFKRFLKSRIVGGEIIRL